MGRAHRRPTEALVQAVARQTALWPDFPQPALLRMGRTFARLTQAGLDAALAPLLTR